jgi:hypothetical protein
MAKTAGSSGNGDSSGRIAFDYIKGQFFRIIRADGALGAVTPTGQIHFALYSERQPIPRREVYTVVDSRLGEKIASETVSRDAIVREMDCDVFLSPEVAESLGRWLLERAAEAREQQKQRQEKEP